MIELPRAQSPDHTRYRSMVAPPSLSLLTPYDDARHHPVQRNSYIVYERKISATAVAQQCPVSSRSQKIRHTCARRRLQKSGLQ